MKIIYKDVDESISIVETTGLDIAKLESDSYVFNYNMDGKLISLGPSNISGTYLSELKELGITYTIVTNLFIEEKVPYTSELTYTCLVGKENYIDFRQRELEKINPEVHKNS